MRIGVQLPEVEYEARWPEIRGMAVRAEEVGFDSVWVGDHLLYDLDGERRGPWEAWTQLAAIAAVTERVQLGPLVAALPFHPPAVLAKMATTVDEISSGRLVLGVGAGWNRVEFDAFGLAYNRRFSRFAEGFEILRRLLDGERVDHAGEFHTVQGAELLPRPRPGGPPLMVGSVGARMLALTLPHVAAWNAWFEDFDNDPGALGALCQRIDRACVEVGRDPADVAYTAALLVAVGSPAGRRNLRNPIRLEELPDALARVEAAGIDEVQLVLDPIVPASLDAVAGTIGLGA